MVIKCFKTDIIKNKIISTNLSVYGAKNPQQNESVRNKTISTNLKLYGSKTPRQNKDINDKALETTNRLYINVRGNNALSSA